MEVNIIPAFPTPIAIVNKFISEEECDDLTKKFNQLVPMKPHPAIDGKAFSSHYTVHDLSNFLSKETYDRLNLIINETANAIGLPKLVLFNSWVNIQHKNSRLKYHSHPNSELSGALYLNVNDDGGRLQLESPNPFVHFTSYKKETVFNDKMWIKPQKGDLVIFPSYVRHGSFDNNMDNRMVFSFNTISPDYKSFLLSNEEKDS